MGQILCLTFIYWQSDRLFVDNAPENKIECFVKDKPLQPSLIFTIRLGPNKPENKMLQPIQSQCHQPIKSDITFNLGVEVIKLFSSSLTLGSVSQRVFSITSFQPNISRLNPSDHLLLTNSLAYFDQAPVNNKKLCYIKSKNPFFIFFLNAGAKDK